MGTPEEDVGKRRDDEGAPTPRDADDDREDCPGRPFEDGSGRIGGRMFDLEDEAEEARLKRHEEMKRRKKEMRAKALREGGGGGGTGSGSGAGDD